MFKGFEEIENMKKRKVLQCMKKMVYPPWIKGGIETWEEKITVQRKTGEHILTMHYSKIRDGSNMSKYPPIIDGHQYTWAELKKYPAPLLKVLAYRLWQEKIGSEEE